MDWQRRDVLARNYLVSTIESEQQRSLINCRTANEMWTRLSAQHLRKAVENQHYSRDFLNISINLIMTS
jgi:hypothetical protein